MSAQARDTMVSPYRNFLTVEQREIILRDFATGVPIKTIAAKIGRPKATVTKWRQRFRAHFDLPVRYRPRRAA